MNRVVLASELGRMQRCAGLETAVDTRLTSTMPKRAVILAGGRGTRLRPFTLTIPKPLVPIGTRPVLDLVLRRLGACGWEHVTIAISEHTKLIKAFFGEGEGWGLKIDYSVETKPLSTMGPLKLIPDLPEDFLVMNGDVLTDIDVGAFYERHRKRGSLFTIASHRRHQKIDYGVLHTSDGRLVGFEEKPSFPFEVSMGVYMVNRRALQFVPEGRPFGFDDLMRHLISINETVHVEQHAGYWLDIGRPEDYEAAAADYEARPEIFGLQEIAESSQGAEAESPLATTSSGKAEASA